MNTKGIKFLAVLAVLAMAFAAFAVLSNVEQDEAGDPVVVPTVTGPLDFRANYTIAQPYAGYGLDGSEKASNVTLGNNILVSYDDATKTYTLTGTLAKQTTVYTTKWSDDNEAGKVFYADYGGDYSSVPYGLVMTSFDGKTDFTMATTSGSTDPDTELLLYLNKDKLTVRTITFDNKEYKVDLTGLTLATSTNPTVPYVAVANTNALAEFGTVAKNITGTDGASGTWSYVKADNNDTATLTLTNYNGKEYFFFDGTMNMDVVLNGTNTISVTAGTAKNGYATNEWYALGGCNTAGASSARPTSIHAGAADASLTINVKGSTVQYAMGILQLVKVGNEGASAAKTTITVDAPYAAIYNYSTTMDIDNATITAKASGKAMNVYGLDLTKSSVKATLSSDNYNADNGFITGLRIKAPSLVLDATSTIEAQGLVINGGNLNTATIAGVVTVSGGFNQPAAGYVAGLQYAGEDAITVYTAKPTFAGAPTGYILLASDATTLGQIVIGDATDKDKKEQEIITATSTEAVTEINDSKSESVVVNVASLDLSTAAPIEVSENKSVELHVATALTANFDVDGQKFAMKDVKGTFKITKGSIYIDGVLQGGTITLEDGADVKITGSVDTAKVTISVATGKKATVTLEADKTLTLAQTLEIGKGITFNVNGKISGAGALDIAEGATVNFNNGSEVNLSAADSLAGEGDYNVLAGAVLKDADYAGTGNLVAYSGSDISGLDGLNSNWAKIKGKDAASGKWTYDATNDVLTLDNYNGTYNFHPFKDNIVTIMLVGDNAVSYAVGKEYPGYTMFATVTSITTIQGTASLTINVDMSKADALNGGAGLIVVDAGALEIDAVGLAINVYGSNADWTETIIKNAKFKGINAASVKLYNADLDMDIMSAYSAEAGYGIDTGKVEITSCQDIVILASGTALKSETNADAYAISIKDTDVVLTGQNKALSVKSTNGTPKALSITNYADLTVNNGAEIVGAVNIAQESSLFVDDLAFDGTMTNNGSVTTTGDVIIAYNAKIENSASFTNTGLMGVYGAIENKTGGIFTNSGTVNVYAIGKNTIETDGAATIILPAENASSDTSAKLKSIAVAAGSLKLNADGTITINAATVKYYSNTGAEITDASTETYKGVLTMSQTTPGSYTLFVSNGTAAITVAYDANEAVKQIGKAYSVSLSGSITNVTTPCGLESNTSAADIAAGNNTFINLATTYADDKADLKVGGTFDNQKTVVLYAKTSAKQVSGTFNGDISAYVATDFGGTFNGNVTSTANVTISGKFTGDVTTTGATVTVSKTMIGNIKTSGNVVIVGDAETTAVLTGNVTMNNSDEEKTLTVKGTMKGVLTYESKYKASTTSTAADTDFSASIAIDGTEKYDGTGLVITAKNGANATASEAVKGGYLALTNADALATGKAMDITVTKDKFAILTSMTLPNLYTLTVEADTTIEVAKVATFTIAGGMKVNKDAIKNYELVTIPVTYGKLAYVMTFDIAEGYTIFSNAEYALSNCDEGSELTLGTAVTATANVALKDGVNVIVNNVKLDLATFDLSMGEGAKITLVGTGNLAFGATGSKTTDGVQTLYFVNGTVEYDENVMTFDGVRFDAASTIAGIAATSSAPSKLNVSLSYAEGEVTLVAGTAAGAITLHNDNYTLNGTKMPVSGEYVISAETVSEAAIADSKIKYTDDDETKPVLKPMTLVTVEGLMMVNANMTINGCYGGDGMLFVADGKTVSIERAAALAIEIGNDAGSFGILSTDVDVEITPVAATSTVAAYVKIEGDVYNGVIAAEGNVAAGNVELKFENVDDEITLGTIMVPEGATLTVLSGKTLKANGLLMNAGTLNFNTETVTSYGTLEYEITFVDDGYTVYTKLANALEVVPEGTEIDIESNLEIENGTIPAGVSLVIADGHYLTVKPNSYLIIGEGITALGADATLSGNIVLAAGAYVIDYAGSNSDIAVYTDVAMTKAAKENSFLVLDSLYATVYAQKDMKFSSEDVADYIDITLINPKIEGYYFSGWLLENGFSVVAAGTAASTALSAGPFVAGTVASKVTVTFVSVAGINYYVDGVLVNILDAPVKEEYGATITAKISNTSAYKGTPLVNGQAYIIIDDTTAKVTGSGVEPIVPTPEPTPEPEVDGITLTDILLIVLVILIAVLVVIVVLRLNRS